MFMFFSVLLATMLASLYAWCETFMLYFLLTHRYSVDRSRKLLRSHVTKLSSKHLHGYFYYLTAKTEISGHTVSVDIRRRKSVQRVSFSRVPP